MTYLYFCLDFWHEQLQCTSNAMKFMSYTYECTHGVRDVDCEFVMVAVSVGTPVYYNILF